MVKKDGIQVKSQFFEFQQNQNPIFQSHSGWNNSLIIKFNLKKNDEINSAFFKKNFQSIVNKEKILVVTSGHVEISKENKKLSLTKFDALNFFFNNQDFLIQSSSDSIFYIISSSSLTEKNLDAVYFNFKKDIIAKDIWGGQCISRSYVGNDLNLVLFDLKPGFKFDDKGHSNEQITWLIDGSMNFYCSNLDKKLNCSNGVDIGPLDPHGGVSNGAIGFDAFFPKREETQYKQEIKVKKF